MPSSSLALSFGVIILAAGASSRMGKPKMLLPWGKTSVIGHLLETWDKAGATQIAVVIAAGDEALGKELERIVFPLAHRIPNPAPSQGMFSSIRCAARWAGWAPNLTHWAIALGDQPHLRTQTLMALLRLASTHPEQVSQLTRQGHPRHPVLLPRAVFQSLADSKCQNLKGFLQTLPVDCAREESDDAGLDLDLDHPADYQKALQLFPIQRE